MKTVKKVAIMAALLSAVLVSKAEAAPVPGVCDPEIPATCHFDNAVHFPEVAWIGLLAYAVFTDKDLPCKHEPIRHVTQAGKGYSFDVTGCEYKAHKSTYRIVQ